MTDADLPAILSDLVKPCWRHQFEVSDAGWWLTRDGARCHDAPWHPQDEVDALIAATLLYMLNEAGPVPIREEFRSRTMVDERLRERLMVAAYGLYMRHMRRRIGPPASR
ncbi:hypothetical protein E1286_05395 [Nonomuraea terrae]|uniref:Uncharacterized protein n=1 Tax=Nonomuraea terrae TaxID=2530383 RepID=A0A4R4ZB73_9ACTN|nr:hypothetical protein [Nonomuraea terrae]TDD54624.1 hypothetical protein E1286_05395 [Nonomuraea terrae]